MKAESRKDWLKGEEELPKMNLACLAILSSHLRKKHNFSELVRTHPLIRFDILLSLITKTNTDTMRISRSIPVPVF